MKYYSFLLLLLCCLNTACAQQRESPAAPEKVISISPADFKDGYPAVLFKPGDGSLTMIRKEQSEAETRSSTANRSLYFFVEPADPEFSAFDEESKTVVALVGNGDKAYSGFNKMTGTAGTDRGIRRKDFLAGNVFYLYIGGAAYVMQLLQYDKKQQQLRFRYRKMM